MPWTDQDEARYQQLGQQLGYFAPPAPPPPSPSIPARIGEGFANLPSTVGSGLINGVIGTSNMFQPAGQESPLFNLPQPYNIPPPQTFGQRAADLIPGLLGTVATAAIPGGIVRAGLGELLGASLPEGIAAGSAQALAMAPQIARAQMLSSLGGEAAAGGFLAAPQGPGEAANLGGQFAGLGLLNQAPLPWYVKALGNAAIPVGGQLLSGQDPTSQQSILNTAANVIVPGLLGGYGAHGETPASAPQGELLGAPSPAAPDYTQAQLLSRANEGRNFDFVGPQYNQDVQNQLTAGQQVYSRANEGRNTDFVGPPVPDGQFVGSNPAPPPSFEASNGTVTAPDPQIDPSLVAYHGTAASFDSFDPTKVGTGEGNAAFGHGDAYLAENPDVADGYRVSLSSESNPGNLYTVSVDAELLELLDRDAPIDSQSPLVQKAAEEAWALPTDPAYAGPPRFGKSSGASLYNQLKAAHYAENVTPEDPFPTGGDKWASQWLSDRGIKGIKYLDAGSRGKGGTSNYVIFDGQHIKITHANGTEISPEEAVSGVRASKPPPGPSDAGPRATPENIAQAMRGVAAQYPGVDLRVHGSPADPPELRGQINPRARYEGLNDPNGANRNGGKGVQYGFTDNISTPERGQKVALHEIVGHYGVGKILDPADWKGIQDHVMERGGALRDSIVKDYGSDPNRIAREYVAQVAENTNLDPTLWQSITAAVRKGLRAIGIRREWSDKEIQDLVRAAHRNLREEGPSVRQGGELEAAASRKPLPPVDYGQEAGRALGDTKATPPAEATPKERQAILDSYRQQVAKTGGRDVPISDVMEGAGFRADDPRAKGILAGMRKSGDVVSMSTGDWSLSDARKRAWAVNDLDRGFLEGPKTLVRMTESPQEAPQGLLGAKMTPEARQAALRAQWTREQGLDPSIRSNMSDAAEKQEKGDKSLLGYATRFLQTNFNMDRSPELKRILEQSKGEANLGIERMNEPVRGLLGYAEKLPRGAPLMQPAEDAALTKFNKTKGDPADEAAMRAAVPKPVADYAANSKQRQIDAQAIKAQAETGGRQATTIKNMGDFVRRTFEIFANSPQYLKRLGRGDYKAALAGAVQYFKEAPEFRGVGDDFMETHVRQVLNNLAENKPFDSGSESGKLAQSLYLHKKDLSNEQWAMMEKLQTDARLSTHDQGLIADAVRKQFIDPATQKRLGDIAEGGALNPTESSMLSEISERETLDPRIRALFGEYTNPVDQIAWTNEKVARSVKQAKAITDIAFSSFADGRKMAYKTAREMDSAIQAATGETKRTLMRYKQLPDSDGYGILAKAFAPMEVHDALNSFNQGMDSGADQFWGKIQKVLKLNATVLNPAAHAHWWMQMPLMMSMARVYNPADWYRAERIVNGNDAASAAVRDELTKNNILQVGAQRDLGNNARTVSTFGELPDTFTKIKTGGDKALGFLGKLYGKPDDIIRTAAYMTQKARALKEGLSEQDAQNRATDFTNKYTFNYDALPRAVTRASSIPGVNPFISYAAELSRITKNIARDVISGSPGDRMHGALNLALMAAVPLAASLGSSQMNLSAKDQQDWDHMRKLEDEDQKAQIKFVLGRDQKTGAFHYVDTAPFQPASDIFTAAKNIAQGNWKGFALDQPGIGLQHSPVASIGIDLSTGQNQFTGQKLYTPGDYASRIWQGVTPPIIGSQAVRDLRAITPNQQGGLGLTNPRTGREDNPVTSLLGHVGVRLQSEQQGQLLQAALSDAQDKRDAARMQMMQIGRTNASDSARQHALLGYQQRVQDINQELLQKVGQ